MPTAEASSGRKAIDYAEGTLEVHGVYERNKALLVDLDKCLTDLSDARDRKRAIEDVIATAEMTVSEDEHAKHSGMSATAMKEHLKGAIFKNPQLTKLRADLTAAVGEIDGCELDQRMLEHEMRMLEARMHQMGGYLYYLAVAKLSQMAERNNSASSVIGIPGW